MVEIIAEEEIGNKKVPLLQDFVGAEGLEPPTPSV
jgi:hypothetical protein